jgi:hypothetical protein
MAESKSAAIEVRSKKMSARNNNNNNTNLYSSNKTRSLDSCRLLFQDSI